MPYRKRYIHLIRNDKIIKTSFFDTRKRREEIISRWRHTLGRIFLECKIEVEVQTSNSKKNKYTQMDHPIQKMKTFIRENFHDTDGDLYETALSIIEEIKTVIKDRDNEIEDIRNGFETIDFGIGSVDYNIATDSNLPVKELFAALQNISNIVPVHEITEKLKSLNRF